MVAMHKATTTQRHAKGRRARATRQFHPAGWWRRILEEQASSGLSQKEFCEQRALAKSTFALWKHRLAASGSRKARRSRPLPSKGLQCTPDADGQFLPVSLISPAVAPLPATASIEIALGHNRRIIVPDHFDAESLRRVIAVLESIPC
jgi:hypothetical protein